MFDYFLKKTILLKWLPFYNNDNININIKKVIGFLIMDIAYLIHVAFYVYFNGNLI